MTKAGRGWLRLCLGTVGLAATFAVYEAAVPRIGQATEAEILSLVPKELREAPPRDPAAEARLLAVLRLAKANDDPADRLRARLDQGPLRAPETPLVQAAIDRRLGFPKLEELLLRSAFDAAEKGDRARCADRAILTLRLIDAYRKAGGDEEEAEVVSSMLSKAGTAFRKMAQRGGLGAAEGRRILASLPPNDGSDLADAVGVDFRINSLPRLVKAATKPDGIVEIYSEFTPYKKIDVGTYDPLETTRLTVAFAQDDRRACRNVPGFPDPALERRAKSLTYDLPTDPSSTNLWERVRWRWIANHRRNTLGRAWIGACRLDPMNDLRLRREGTLTELRMRLPH